MVARHLAVAELEGMQHIADLTMEVSSDANVVVEEGPQTSTGVNHMSLLSLLSHVILSILIQKVSKKSQETRQRRSYCSVYPKCGECDVSESLVLALTASNSSKIPRRECQHERSSRPTAKQRAERPATASNISFSPSRSEVPSYRPSWAASGHNPNGPDRLVAHHPPCYRISARRSQRRSLRSGHPEVFIVFRCFSISRKASKFFQVMNWEWWLFPGLFAGHGLFIFAFLGAMHFIDLLAGGVLASLASLASSAQLFFF